MMKAINFILISLIALVAFPSSNLVDGKILRANQIDEQRLEERKAEVHNAAVERALQRRQRNRNGNSGKGKGKGGSMMSMMSMKSSHNYDNDNLVFLSARIEPIPGVNCIPLLSDNVDDHGGKKGMKSAGKGKGKGGSSKGKGGSSNERNNNRRNRRQMSRLLKSSKGKGKGSGQNRGGTRNGQRNGNGNHQHMMTKTQLPYCPPDATFFPTSTFFPSFTPVPTVTDVPSSTPLPSWTPFPSDDGLLIVIPLPPAGPPGPGPGPGPPGPGPGPPGPAPSQPTLVPGSSLPPTRLGQTLPPTKAGASAGPGPGAGVPVAIPPGTERILVESNLNYGFFTGTQVREPTAEELAGVMEQTTLFYTELLQAKYPNLDSFEAKLVTSRFTPGSDLPVFIDFDANAFFATGTTVPSPQEIFQTLQDADYESYIMNYVWNATPANGLFFDTQRAQYNARVMPGRRQIR